MKHRQCSGKMHPTNEVYCAKEYMQLGQEYAEPGTECSSLPREYMEAVDESGDEREYSETNGLNSTGQDQKEGSKRRRRMQQLQRKMGYLVAGAATVVVVSNAGVNGSGDIFGNIFGNETVSGTQIDPADINFSGWYGVQFAAGEYMQEEEKVYSFSVDDDQYEYRLYASGSSFESTDDVTEMPEEFFRISEMYPREQARQYWEENAAELVEEYAPNVDDFSAEWFEEGPHKGSWMFIRLGYHDITSQYPEIFSFELDGDSYRVKISSVQIAITCKIGEFTPVPGCTDQEIIWRMNERRKLLETLRNAGYPVVERYVKKEDSTLALLSYGYDIIIWGEILEGGSADSGGTD